MDDLFKSFDTFKKNQEEQKLEYIQELSEKSKTINTYELDEDLDNDILKNLFDDYEVLDVKKR